MLSGVRHGGPGDRHSSPAGACVRSNDPSREPLALLTQLSGTEPGMASVSLLGVFSLPLLSSFHSPLNVLSSGSGMFPPWCVCASELSVFAVVKPGVP